MTWKTFIGPFKESEFIRDTPGNIIKMLFDKAGCKKTVSENAAKNWYYNYKPCPAYSYFSNGEINNAKLHDFFRKRPDSKLEKLQQNLRETIDCNSPIDLETKDWDIFCWSLVNQFLDLLGFQRIDITEILPDNETVSGNQTSDNETANNNQASDDKTVSGNQASTDETVSGNESSDGKNPSDNQTSDDEGVDIETEFITSENNEESDINQADSQNTFFDAQLSIPNDCKICLCCENWEGNTKNANKSIAGVYGTCIVYDKKILSTTDGTNCHMFIPNYGQINKFKVHQKYKALENLTHSIKKN